jgi:peptidoglycan/LPS O-acetylase OafA/YrhL
MFRVGSWLLGCIIVCGFTWSRRETPEGAFALGVCGSAVLYVLTFFAVGVASDFRYGYWAVLACIAGGAVATLGARKPQAAVSSGSACRKTSRTGAPIYLPAAGAGASEGGVHAL